MSAPLPPTAEVIEEAIARAADEEQRFTGDLRSFGEHLAVAGRAASPAPWSGLVVADGLLCQLSIASPEEAAQWGSNLVPNHVQDGTASPPHVGAFADALKPYLEQRAERTVRPDAEGRYRDFIWLRWRDGGQGSRAIEPYIAAAQAFDLSNDEQAMNANDTMLRAVRLATELRHHMEPTRVALEAMMRAFCERDLTLGLLELGKAGARILSLEPAATRQLREDLAAAVDASPEFLGKQQILQTCVVLARTLGDADSANAHLRAEAALCEQQAEGQAGLFRQHWLRDAIRLSREAGDGESQQRLRSAYEEAGAQINEADLFTVTGEVLVSLDDVRTDADTKALGQETSVPAFLRLPFEIGLWPSWDSVRAAREAEDRQTFTSLFSHAQIEADGRVQPEPDRDTHPEDFARARDIRWASKRAIMTAGFADLLIDEFRKRGAWTAPNLTTVIAFVDEPLAQACERGFVRFEAGDAWSALHILAPQVERAVRVLAKDVGARVTSYTPHEGTRWVSLNTLLEAPNVRAAMTEDLAKGLEAVFIEPYGQNIRNNIAHGAFAYPSNSNNAATLCVLALLTVAAVIAQWRARAVIADAPTEVAADLQAPTDAPTG